ncbi:hypothetical protein ACFY36_45215 [Actinoplanes sp. NPDC000266]
MSTLPAEPDRERAAAAVRLRFEPCPDRLAAEIAAPVAVTVAAKVQMHGDSAERAWAAGKVGRRPVRGCATACPQLPERGHGSWYFDCAVPVLPGRRERLRRDGYPTRREAVAARDALLGDGVAATAEGWTVERWLRYWLTTRTRIRPTTLRSPGGTSPT